MRERGDFRVTVTRDDTGAVVATATYRNHLPAAALDRADHYRAHVARLRGIAAPLTATVERLPDGPALPLALGRH